MTESYKARENWKKNEEKLFLLYRDSIDLEKIYLQTIESRSYGLHPVFVLNPASNLGTEHRKALEYADKSKRKMGLFKKLKFWELGNLSPQYLDSTGTNILDLLLENHQDESLPNWIDKLPPQILALTPQEVWKKFALSFLNQAQDYIKQIDLNVIPCSSAIDYIFPPFFKTVDFMYKQEFVDDKAIKLFFKDREILYIAGVCTYDLFQKHYSHKLQPRHPCTYDPFRKKFSHMMQAFIDIEENWFWPFGFKFYNALNNQDLLWIKFDFLNACMEDVFCKLLGEEEIPEFEEWLKSHCGKNDGRMNMLLDVKHDPTNSEIKKQGAFDDEVGQLIKILKRIYVKDHTLLIDHTKREIFITAICEMLDFIEKYFSHGIIADTPKHPGINDEHFEEKLQLILASTRILNVADLAIEYKKICKSDAIESSKGYPFHNKYINSPYADKMKSIYAEFKKIYSRIEERKDELSNWLKDQKDIETLSNIEELRYEYRQIFHEMGIK
ncbi:hypothetical protein PGT21_005834 [Puccinia graminis f. sp. tritici]|uniref:Uncharacterized protein n=1 Tax=Puccinia graminis f. sp. tritici TaxID=56615 RepID=A0A5B0QEE0_PUCGR|nr:hypothetical protein PGT21_005834 [Puccinia graminis f. sp. tritici]